MSPLRCCHIRSGGYVLLLSTEILLVHAFRFKLTSDFHEEYPAQGWFATQRLGLQGGDFLYQYRNIVTVN